MADFRLDLRYAARSLLLRTPGLTAVCVLTLGLGIGVTTATFTVVNGVLIEPLPYGDPDRIVRVYRGSQRSSGFGFLSGANFADYRERLTSFESLAGYYDYTPEGIDLTLDDRAQRLDLLRVSSGFFETLGTEPMLGRGFLPEEEIPPGAGARDPDTFVMVTAPSAPTVVLSHDFWRRSMGADPDIVGTLLPLGGSSFEIVGVMPPGFGGLIGGDVDVWAPLDLAPGGVNTRDNSYLSVVGRLREGVALETAQGEFDRVAAALALEYPAANENLAALLVPLRDDLIGDSSRMLLLLFGAVTFVLLVACVNIANLFLARGLAREKELAIRTALGARRGDLLRLTVTESLLIAGLGGAVGIALSALGIRGLLLLRPEALPRYDAVAMDLPMLVFAAGVSLLTGLAFGMIPLWRGSGLASGAARSDRGTVGRTAPRVRRLQGGLAVVQVALALMLLVCCGLLLRSFNALNEIDLGFDANDVVTYQLRLPDYRYGEPESRRVFYRSLHESLAALPGVKASAATSKLPASGHRNQWGFGIEGRQRQSEGPSQNAEVRCIDGDFFEALAISVLRGRAFSETDRSDSEPVILINQTLADLHWPSGDPIGERIRTGGAEPRTIVGVVADTRHEHREAPTSKVYIPHAQFADDRNWDLSFMVALEEGATRRRAADVVSAIEREVAALDPQLAIYDVATMESVAERPIARQRFASQLMSVFAALTLLLAAVGVYGVLAYTVSQRHAEIGVRMALGAGKRQVLGLVARQGLAITMGGVLLGLAGSLLLSRVLGALLFDVSPADPIVLALTVSLLVLVALLAACVPARRALHVDPVESLRED